MRSLIPIFINTNTTKTPNYLHHAGLYGITEKDAYLQMKIGNTKNRDVVHYSSELVIDTDNVETAEKVWDRLYSQDYTFELYKLNNYKFFLQRGSQDEPSNIMCYQDKQFIKDYFIDCNINHGLDLNIYNSPFHICRTKKSIHEITGSKTELVSMHTGNNFICTNDVEVKKYERPLNFNTPLDINTSHWDNFRQIIEFSVGVRNNKHLTFWQMSKDLQNICSFSTLSEIALMYAKHLGYEEEKCLRALRQGYEVERC